MSAAECPSLDAGEGAEVRKSIIRWSATLPLAMGVVAFERRILAVDRGLDTTDEAFYLLAAGVADRDIAWGLSAFQWHTRSMLLLAGHDISWFRTFGAVVLLLSAIVLAVGLNSMTPDRSDAFGRIALLVTLPVASHLYYAAMLRTPSYNLINLAGMMLAAGGSAFAISTPRPAVGWSWSSARAPVLIAGGLVLAAPAKPSTPFLGLGIVIATLLATRGRAVTVRVATRTIGLMTASIVLLIVTGVWSRTPWVVLVRGLRAPALETEQTVMSALADAVTVPLQAAQMLLGLPAWRVVGPILLGVILALASHGLLRRASGAALGLLVLTVLAAHRTAPVPMPWQARAGDAFAPGWASEPLADALVVVTLVGVTTALVTVLLRRHRGDRASDSAMLSLRRDVVVALSLLMWPVVFGFGSGNGNYRMMAHAGVFLIGATLVLLRHVRGPSGRILDIGVPVVTVVLTASVIAAGWHAPYGTAPLRENTVAVTLIPDRPRSVVRLDPVTAGWIGDIRDVVGRTEWTGEDRLLVISPPWGALEPLVLGARPVDSVLITIHGSPGSSAVADYSLAHLDGSWRDAWILITVQTEGRSGDRWDDAIAELEAGLTVATGRAFPHGYVCVAQHAGYQMHRPRSDSDATRPDGCGGGG